MMVIIIERVTKNVSIDKNKWDELSKWGYRASEVFDLAVDILLSDDMDYCNHKMRIQFLKDKLHIKEVELEHLKGRIENAQIAYETSLSEYDEMKLDLNIIMGDYEDVKETLERSRIIGKVNDIAIRNDFNIIIIKQLCKEWINDLIMIDNNFDIEEHVMALKRFLNT